MAIEKNININVTSTGTGQVSDKIESLEKSLNRVDAGNKSVTKSFASSTNAVLENGGAMGLLNDLTGGVAMTFKDAVEATGLFGGALGKLGTAWSSMGKMAKLAIASTGIGLLVIAVGTLVAYWDDIQETLSGVSSEMVKQTGIAF